MVVRGYLFCRRSCSPKSLPTKGNMRFGKKGKLSPSFIGPFLFLRIADDVACELALPPKLSNVLLVFHVSLLKKFVLGNSCEISYEKLEPLPDFS